MKLHLALAAILFAAPLAAQTPYQLTMSYDRTGLAVPHWTLTLPDSGSATYTGKPTQGVDPGTITVPVSTAGREKLGTLLAHSNKLQPCETHSKGIANMGAKDITFTPSGEPAQHCIFNYTDNKPLAEAADYLIAITATVQAGLDLERLHRYDRLGLDAALARLQNEVKSNRAAELGAIRPTLESLIKDDALMDRVRSRAQALLDLAGTAQ